MGNDYTCFGLKINSEILLTGLKKESYATGTADIMINLGEVPKALPGSIKTRDGFEVGERQVLIRSEDGTLILASNGNCITVQTSSEVACQNNIVNTLLGSALGAILQQRGNLALHASAITRGADSILICGKSGRGKSTTLTEMMQRGYGYSSDDVSRLAFTPESVTVYPSYPQVRLWEETLNHYSLDEVSKKLVKQDASAKKYALKCSSHFIRYESAVRAFVYLSQKTSITPSITRVYGKEVFAILRNNIYRKAFLVDECLKQNIGYIEQFAKLVPIYQLTRPEEGNSIAKVGDLVETLINEHTAPSNNMCAG